MNEVDVVVVGDCADVQAALRELVRSWRRCRAHHLQRQDYRSTTRTQRLIEVGTLPGRSLLISAPARILGYVPRTGFTLLFHGVMLTGVGELAADATHLFEVPGEGAAFTVHQLIWPDGWRRRP